MPQEKRKRWRTKRMCLSTWLAVCVYIPRRIGRSCSRWLGADTHTPPLKLWKMWGFPSAGETPPSMVAGCHRENLGWATGNRGDEDSQKVGAGRGSRRQPMERFGNVMHADAVLEGHESAQRWQPKGGFSCHGFHPCFGACHGPPSTACSHTPPLKLWKQWKSPPGWGRSLRTRKSWQPAGVGKLPSGCAH
jgi:hypothetical protein